MIKITDVNVKKVNEKGNLLGFARIVIEDAICISNIRIIQGKDRVFVAMPNKKTKEKFVDTTFPINQETRQYIEDIILSAYNIA